MQNKILIIEDEESLRNIMYEMLSNEDFEVMTASNGKIGVEIAQQEIPDLVICDIMMPEKSGYDVLTTLRQDFTTAIVPFIFLTAKASKSDIRQGIELGADDYLTKPFTRAELLGAVMTRIEKHSALIKRCTKEQDNNIYNYQMQEKEIFYHAQERAFNNFIEQLRVSVAKINMAIYMLGNTESQEQCSRYWEILENECFQEMSLINEFSRIKSFMTPANIQLLRQYKLIQD